MLVRNSALSTGCLYPRRRNLSARLLYIFCACTKNIAPTNKL